MISTVAAQFGFVAIPLFEDYLRRHPQSAEAHELFAELRAERGEDDHFMDGFVQALADFPENKALLTSYWNTLTRAGRMQEALELRWMPIDPCSKAIATLRCWKSTPPITPA